jgi:molybdopterin/thiamine biosynthesis adenylyltransferase/SAM-dependent methyltransferase
LNSATPLQLRRSLSARESADGDRIAIGSFPPAAREIRSPPPYLAELLRALSSPVAATDAVEQVASAVPGSDPDEVAAALDDLRQVGIVTEARSGGRFDRHELYFGLLDIEPGRYLQALARSTVGLVGCGGVGSTCGMLLAAAGVGRLIVSDGDSVESTNLSRSTLLEEVDVGRRKVWAVARRLQARNSRTRVDPIDSPLVGEEFLVENFASCDVLILSADSPKEVHQWTDRAAARLDVPYVNVGYVETLGSVGPFTVPGSTPCWDCQIGDGACEGPELNEALQAASYGPLNALVSSIGANEVIRWLLGLPLACLGTRLLVDSTDYMLHSFAVTAREGCPCTVGRGASAGSAFASVAADYEQRRDTESANRIVIDDLVVRLVDERGPRRVLDVGAGTGTVAMRLAELGHNVTALDSSPEMVAAFSRRVPCDLAGNVEVRLADMADLECDERFDCVLLNCLLDHIDDPRPLLARCHDVLEPGGRLVMAVPHPFKDAGAWQKRGGPSGWEYGDFVVRNYFAEGLITKSREDEQGDTTVARITSHRRTVETYFRLLTEARFAIEALLEPAPQAPRPTATFDKASRVPYFLVLSCSKSAAT